MRHVNTFSSENFPVLSLSGRDSVLVSLEERSMVNVGVLSEPVVFHVVRAALSALINHPPRQVSPPVTPWLCNCH